MQTSTTPQTAVIRAIQGGVVTRKAYDDSDKQPDFSDLVDSTKFYSQDITVKVFAEKADFFNSALAEATFTVGYDDAAVAPTFSLASGTVSTHNLVEIKSTTEGAEIYYTTDGNDPNTSSDSGRLPAYAGLWRNWNRSEDGQGHRSTGWV